MSAKTAEVVGITKEASLEKQPEGSTESARETIATLQKELEGLHQEIQTAEEDIKFMKGGEGEKIEAEDQVQIDALTADLKAKETRKDAILGEIRELEAALAEAATSTSETTEPVADQAPEQTVEEMVDAYVAAETAKLTEQVQSLKGLQKIYYDHELGLLNTAFGGEANRLAALALDLKVAFLDGEDDRLTKLVDAATEDSLEYKVALQKRDAVNETWSKITDARKKFRRIRAVVPIESSAPEDPLTTVEAPIKQAQGETPRVTTPPEAIATSEERSQLDALESKLEHLSLVEANLKRSREVLKRLKEEDTKLLETIKAPDLVADLWNQAHWKKFAQENPGMQAIDREMAELKKQWDDQEMMIQKESPRFSEVIKEEKRKALGGTLRDWASRIGNLENTRMPLARKEADRLRKVRQSLTETIQDTTQERDELQKASDSEALTATKQKIEAIKDKIEKRAKTAEASSKKTLPKETQATPPPEAIAARDTAPTPTEAGPTPEALRAELIKEVDVAVAQEAAKLAEQVKRLNPKQKEIYDSRLRRLDNIFGTPQKRAEAHLLDLRLAVLTARSKIEGANLRAAPKDSAARDAIGERLEAIGDVREDVRSARERHLAEEPAGVDMRIFMEE